MSIALTVTVIVFVQPVLFIYVITEVPAVSPLTIPALFIVAIPGLEEVQGVLALGIEDPVKLVVEPTHTLLTPVIVGIFDDRFAETAVLAIEVQFVFVAST